MKVLFFTACFLLTHVFSSSAQIKFEDFNWTKISETSIAEKKIIMVEVTAKWCYWCKVMEKKVFPKKEVGDFFNANFINVKLYDTDSGAEEFSIKYKIESYPTFLFLDSAGNQLYRINGAITDAKDFILEAKSAVKE